MEHYFLTLIVDTIFANIIQTDLCSKSVKSGIAPFSKIYYPITSDLTFYGKIPQEFP